MLSAKTLTTKYFANFNFHCSVALADHIPKSPTKILSVLGKEQPRVQEITVGLGTPSHIQETSSSCSAALTFPCSSIELENLFSLLYVMM